MHRWGTTSTSSHSGGGQFWGVVKSLGWRGDSEGRAAGCRQAAMGIQL